MDEPSGPSLGGAGESMAVDGGGFPGRLDKRGALGCRTHNTSDSGACS